MSGQNEYSTELETLDQLLGGDLPLSAIRTLFPNDDRFLDGVRSLLAEGEVRLITVEGRGVQEWETRTLFGNHKILQQLAQYRLVITPAGARRIG